MALSAHLDVLWFYARTVFSLYAQKARWFHVKELMYGDWGKNRENNTN
jgi:hypothetical protein